MDLDELYQDLLLDHHKNPRCYGKMESPDKQAEVHNPLCGDVINIELKLDGDVVSDFSYTGSGCLISQAGASLLSEVIIGKNLAEIAELSDTYDRMLKSSVPEEELECLGDLQALSGVKQFPARYKCAKLAFMALNKASKDE